MVLMSTQLQLPLGERFGYSGEQLVKTCRLLADAWLKRNSSFNRHVRGAAVYSKLRGSLGAARYGIPVSSSCISALRRCKIDHLENDPEWNNGSIQGVR